MSELKTRFIDDTYAEYFNTGNHELAQIYIKSEVDDVISELENKIRLYEDLGSCKKGCPALRHNQRRVESEIYRVKLKEKEIAELEMKLAAAKLVLRLNEPKALYSNLDTMSRLNHKIDVVGRRECHQKYKRCLAMTEEWRSYAAFCGIQSSWHNNRGFGKTAEKWTWKECHAWKCLKRWQGLAEKFKEVK